MVIVAPTRAQDGLPDLAGLKAFRCRGNQAVTYAPGCWHAPMVVVDERGGGAGAGDGCDSGEGGMDFVVVQSENGTAMDCEEVLIADGGVPVLVGQRMGNWGLWEPRL